MSKGLGRKIAIKFTEDIINLVETIKTPGESINGKFTANGTYTGSLVNNVIDGSTSTYWESRTTGNYIQVEVGNVELAGFSIYKGSSYRPSTYTLEASDDGVNFTSVKSGSFVASTGWETVTLDVPIAPLAIRLKCGFTTRLYIYEFKMIINDYRYTGQEFKVEWQEPKHVGGPLIDRVGYPKRLQQHPEDPSNTILLTMYDTQRFHNAEGQITLSYDHTKSNLQGRGGVVASFYRSFLPSDLEPKPNPHDEEQLSVIARAEVDFMKVTYNNAYADEIITVGASAVVDFAYVGIINP